MAQVMSTKSGSALDRNYLCVHRFYTSSGFADCQGLAVEAVSCCRSQHASSRYKGTTMAPLRAIITLSLALAASAFAPSKNVFSKPTIRYANEG
jgi:hypothetical protein